MKWFKKISDVVWNYIANKVASHMPTRYLAIDWSIRGAAVLIIQADRNGELKVISDSFMQSASYKQLEDTIRHLVKEFHINHVIRDYPKGYDRRHGFGD